MDLLTRQPHKHMQLHTGRYRLRQISHAWMKGMLGKQQPLLPVTYVQSKWESMANLVLNFAVHLRKDTKPNVFFLFVF